MKRNGWLKAYFLLLLLIVLAGCGGKTDTAGENTGENTAANSAKQPNETKQTNWPAELRIGYQKSSFLLLLKQEQLLENRLKQHGVKVEWFEFQSGPPLLEALNSGKIDAGYSGGAPAVFAQAVSGSQLTYLAYEPEVARAIVVPAGSPIKTVSDLKGKKVAFSKGSSAHYTVLTALEAEGLTLNDVQPVFLQPSDARPAFERGDVDAWAIWDPYLGDAEKNANATILVDAKGLPRQFGFILGRKPFISQYPEIRQVLLEEMETIHKKVQEDPKGAAARLAEGTGLPEEIWELTLKRREYGIFPLNDEVIAAQQRIADRFFSNGLLQTEVKVQDAVWK